MSKTQSSKVYEITVKSFDELFQYFHDWKKMDWIFRGQYKNWDLETTLERACENSGLKDINDRHKIEDNMIRQFKRVYDGNDRERVEEDTLYALSVMRHHGAPTRLMDFTYSKYVGIYFALEYANDNALIDGKKCGAVWCINTDWLKEAARDSDIPKNFKNLINKRKKDKTRTDKTFRPLYLKNMYSFVGQENPLGLHQRLHIQQGVFLCPGNIKRSFMDNLKELKGWNQKESIIKVNFLISIDDLHNAINESKRMNISRESLFPGLDGFAQSMRYHLDFYRY